jgi:amino-acid N-acetyltransferase
MTEALEMTTGRLAQHRFWVAEENGRIIGCVALAPIDNITAAVRTFFIEPEHKGRGIGKQLWFALLTIAQSQGLTRLSARPDPASLPFYESIGFKTEAFAPSPHVPCVNVPRMWREI